MPRKKRRSAWASITELDKGERYRIRYWAETSEGYRRKSETVRGTRMDAERRRSELMLLHSEDAPCPTVGQAWERWVVPDMERMVDGGDMAPHSLSQYKSGWTNHVAPTWADVPLDGVRPLLVQQWITSMGYSAAQRAVGILRRVMDYAVRYEYVTSNPMREKYVMPSRQTVARRDDGVWSLAELGTLWRDAALGQWWEAAFLLAAFGGLRVGEAVGVRSEDVSVVEACGQRVTVVEVSRQIANRGVPDENLKNRWSRRPVAIAGRAGERLAAIARVADGWLTGDGLGGWSTQRRVIVAWNTAIAALSPELRHPFKNLRNSWQTNMRWTMRMPPWLIEPMMGHVGEGVTGQHYDRPRALMFAEAVAEAYAQVPYDAGWDWAIWD